jgi:type I restriction enzyme, S subunit
MNTNGWPQVSLGEVITRADNRVSVIATQEYPNFGIYSFGRGLFPKPPINGTSSSAVTLFRARSHQFVYSRLFAFEGAYGVVTSQFDGCFVSNEFPLFDCDPRQILPGFLGWLFRYPEVWADLARLTNGMGNRRQRVQPEALLGYRIPLPPLEEQERIVAKVDRLAGKIAEVQLLRKRAAEQCNQVCRAILVDDRYGEPVPTPMHELVTWRKPDVQVDPTQTYHFAGIYCFGRGVFRGERRTGMDFAYKQLTQIRADEFVYPKLMAWEGALAVVPQDCDGLYVSPEFPVFTINEERVLPEVLDVYFRSPTVWPLLSGASTGTNVRRKRLNPNDFLKYQFPLPPRRVQLAVRAARRKIDVLRPLHDQKLQIDALLPAILDRAFRGAL